MPRKKKFPAVDDITLHFANLHYYQGCISAIEHLLKTGLDETNAKKTLEVYRCLLANEDPKGDKA